MRALTLNFNYKFNLELALHHFKNSGIICVNGEDPDYFLQVAIQDQKDFDMLLMATNNPMEMMPKSLRNQGVETPLVVFTGIADVDFNVKMLKQGADHVQPMPFNIEEALAFIRAVDRRAKRFSSNVITVGDFSMDLNAREVTMQGKRVHLTKSEFVVLERIVKGRGKVVTRDALMQVMYESDDRMPHDKIIDIYICRCRQKTRHDLIETVFGQGFRTPYPHPEPSDTIEDEEVAL